MVAFLELTKDLVPVPANQFGAIFIDVEIVKVHGPVCVVFAIQDKWEFLFSSTICGGETPEGPDKQRKTAGQFSGMKDLNVPSGSSRQQFIVILTRTCTFIGTETIGK